MGLKGKLKSAEPAPAGASEPVPPSVSSKPSASVSVPSLKADENVLTKTIATYVQTAGGPSAADLESEDPKETLLSQDSNLQSSSVQNPNSDVPAVSNSSSFVSAEASSSVLPRFSVLRSFEPWTKSAPDIEIEDMMEEMDNLRKGSVTHNAEEDPRRRRRRRRWTWRNREGTRTHT